MNSNCKTCDVEQECGYEYKPCDCCNYRKFKPKPPQSAQVIPFPAKLRAVNGFSCEATEKNGGQA